MRSLKLTYRILRSVLVSLGFMVAITLLLSACSENKSDTLLAPPKVAFVQKTPEHWRNYQAQKQQQKIDYIQEHQAAYDWFADFAFSETDGVPYIILRLLPVIAPEIWGAKDNFLEVVGLFNDERQQGYPMPRGIGISAFSRSDPMGAIDYTSFTCAACHIGRVLDEEGNTIYLDGGVNTEFNLVLYRVKVFQTLSKIIGDETNDSKKNQRLVNAFLAALEESIKDQPHFFYQQYRNAWVNFDAAYEAQQIALFKQQAKPLITQFAARAEAEYLGYAALIDKNYEAIQQRSLEGFPGMADATGISTVNGYNRLKEGFFTQWFASFVLPNSPGITDFMSVWEQGKRKASWDASHQRLISGGGQWNGNIPIPMYRNLAAQLTLGLENNDIRVSAFGVELLDGLPASVYPFDVNIDLAKKGEVLFKEHCAQCHQPHNGKVYTHLNVNLDRTRVVNWIIRKGGVDSFFDACSPETVISMAGKETSPCAEFDDVSLVGKKELIMSPNNEHHGYNARPLSGIWAQAPYLHNGSVPTLYHLLVPDERPKQFIKSRLHYDQKHVGFSWQEESDIYCVAPRLPDSNHRHQHSKPLLDTSSDSQASSLDKALTLPALPSYVDTGYLFDTTSFPAFSRIGHDQDITEDGKTYKLNWSDDRAGLWALIEYLKTL